MATRFVDEDGVEIAEKSDRLATRNLCLNGGGKIVGRSIAEPSTLDSQETQAMLFPMEVKEKNSLLGDIPPGTRLQNL